MKKPNFIIAGFPKCGTTSLYHYLNEHPQIFMPNQKELHFFTFEILSKLKNGPRDKIVKKTHERIFSRTLASQVLTQTIQI